MYVNKVLKYIEIRCKKIMCYYFVARRASVFYKQLKSKKVNDTYNITVKNKSLIDYYSITLIANKMFLFKATAIFGL